MFENIHAPSFGSASIFCAFHHGHQFGGVHAVIYSVLFHAFNAAGREVFVIVRTAGSVSPAYEFEGVACFLGLLMKASRFTFWASSMAAESLLKWMLLK